MKSMIPRQSYISVYYSILCLYKISAKLTNQQKIECCKNFECDETVDDKVCGARKENGVYTYMLFDNECLLLKYGCQVNETEAYGVINMKYCDVLTSEYDHDNCQKKCNSDVKQPVCGIRIDGEGFRIKIFRNKCQLHTYNCKWELKFNITDFFICNRQGRYPYEESYNFNKEEMTRNNNFENNTEQIFKHGISDNLMKDVFVTNEQPHIINTSSSEVFNVKQNFDVANTLVNTEPNNIEAYTTYIDSKEIYDMDPNTTTMNNIETGELIAGVPEEKNKNIFKNIVVVRGSTYDIRNINTTADEFFDATHVFDLPIRETHTNLTEHTRRMMIKKFGPVKIFVPHLELPKDVKEDYYHQPTLKSCFHKCPTKCPDTYAPVCGLAGVVAREPSVMFQNHCFMDVAQCKMFWEDKSPTAKSSSYIEASFMFCLGYELNGLYRFLPLVRSLQRMGLLKNKGKFRYKLKNMKFFNLLMNKEPKVMG